jgi:hypothetical protein
MLLPIRIDNNAVPALIAGGLLLVAAIVLIVLQFRAQQQLMLHAEPDDAGYAIAERQIRHRFLVGGMLFLLGIAIPLGDQLDFFFRGRPGWFFAYWMGVLALVFAMVIIVLGDVVSTLAYVRVSQVELRHERRELEEEIRRFRAEQNGHAGQAGESERGPSDS